MRRAAAALGLALLLCGCGGLRTGPVERPDPYPDQSTPEAAWHTFLWASKTGDLPVLASVTMFRLRNEGLEAPLREHGPEKTAAMARETWADAAVLDAGWDALGEALGYLRVTMSTRALPRRRYVYSFVRRPDGWALSARLELH